MENIFRVLWYFMIVMFISKRIISPLLRTMANRSVETRTQGDKATFKSRNESDEKTEASMEIEMVKDAYCDKYVQKNKAFQIVDHEGSAHYFCSWDCRQKYISETKGDM